MSSRSLPPGESLGVAGGGLGDADWAANADVARIGQQGERRTGEILDRMCAEPGGATVLHDVRIPGSRANVDHVVITGRQVWLIDSKVWRPGLYWRLGDRAYRGMERFEPAERKTTSMAAARLANHLQRELRSQVSMSDFTTTVIAWPSRHEGRLSLLMLGRVGKTPLVGPKVFGWLTHSMIGTKTRLGRPRDRAADPRIVQVLSRLLVTPTSSRADWEAAEYVASRDQLATAGHSGGRQGRQPAGSPQGGRFASTGRGESTTPLSRDPYADDTFGDI